MKVLKAEKNNNSKDKFFEDNLEQFAKGIKKYSKEKVKLLLLDK